MWIAFEGGEGSGKSTQAALFAERIDAVLTREPGATPLGVQLRSLLLSPKTGTIDAHAETLLMAADRAQNLRDVVLPALADGRHVVTDRSVYSSMAYQGEGRQLGFDAVREVNQWALGDHWPDLVVLLDIDFAQARARLGDSLDRFEQEGETFHRSIFDAYRKLASLEPDRWVTVDASGDQQRVAEDLWQKVSPRLV